MKTDARPDAAAIKRYSLDAWYFVVCHQVFKVFSFAQLSILSVLEIIIP